MAGNVKCKGYDCPLRNICHRYLVEELPHGRQTYYDEDPRGPAEDRTKSFKRKSPKMCYYFWPAENYDKGNL